MKSIIGKLAATPWIIRQLTKGIGYVAAPLAVILAKAEVTMPSGEEVDIFTANQEGAIVAAVVAFLAAAVELLASYATHRAKS